MATPAWLIARPVAHRGFHGTPTGHIENTLPAVEAAVEHGYAIEVDLQLARCGEAMVFHDFTLERLTTAPGPVVHHTAAELKQAPFKDTTARMPTLVDLLEVTRGRSPLFLELKSRFDGAPRLVERVANALADYKGPVAVMSFDPAVVVKARAAIADRPIGIVAEVFGDHWEWDVLSTFQKYQYSNLNHVYETRPDFVAYNVKHLPSVPCEILHWQRGMPILTWTVRTPEQRETAAKHADQMIFEGFVP
jgi:glycerophosphoryl diester phosphodiesterase